LPGNRGMSWRRRERPSSTVSTRPISHLRPRRNRTLDWSDTSRPSDRSQPTVRKAHRVRWVGRFRCGRTLRRVPAAQRTTPAGSPPGHRAGVAGYHSSDVAGFDSAWSQRHGRGTQLLTSTTTRRSGARWNHKAAEHLGNVAHQTAPVDAEPQNGRTPKCLRAHV
jgi:hypothetical protein